jgi:hypothetical protein
MKLAQRRLESRVPHESGNRLHAGQPSGGHASSGGEADESIAAPKGHGPLDPAAFSLQSGHFWGPLEGTIIALLDPKPAAAG